MHPDIVFLQTVLDERLRERKAITLANLYRAEIGPMPSRLGLVWRTLKSTVLETRRLWTGRNDRQERRRIENPAAGA